MEDNIKEPGDKIQSSMTFTRTRSDKDSCGLQETDNITAPPLDGYSGSEHKINSKVVGTVDADFENIRCDFCGKVFSRFAHKKRHMISTNCAEKFQEKGGKCYYCKIEFKSKDLKQHYIEGKCNNINPYNASRKQDVFCDFCGRGFVSLYSKKNHLIKTACVDKFPNKVGVCHFCKKDFEGKDLKAHLVKRNCKNTVRVGLSNNFVCDFCNIRFSNFDQKKKHIIATVCTDNYLELLGVCHFCKKQFKGNDLKEHYIQDNCVSVNSFTAWENQEYYCDFCGNGFKEFANKRNHIIKSNCTKKYAGKFGVCYYCKIEFKSKDLQQHYRENICGEKSRKGSNKQNVCDFCGKIFVSFVNKKGHIINTNCTDRFPEKFGVCNYCKKEFKSNDLKEHYRTNACKKVLSQLLTKPKSFFCDFCAVGFTLVKNKKIHIMNTDCVNRFPDKFGVCYLCKKRFKSKDLRMHYKTNACKHTSTSTLRNETSFLSKISLKKEKFGIKVNAPCQLCDKVFRKRCELKSHLKYSTCPFLNREKQINCSKCSVALFGKEYKTHLLGNRCTIKIK